MATMSCRGTITSLARLSSKEKMDVIISFSISLNTPVSLPVSSMDLISSSDTSASSVSLCMPMSFKKPLVDRDNSRIKGFSTREIMKIGRTQNRLKVSAFCSAMRLGTSSPNTRLK